MRIHWPNVFVLFLAVVAAVVVLRHGTALATFLGSVPDIGPGHSTDERTLGLIAFGIAAVCLVAILKILTNSRRH